MDIVIKGLLIMIIITQALIIILWLPIIIFNLKPIQQQLFIANQFIIKKQKLTSVWEIILAIIIFQVPVIIILIWINLVKQVVILEKEEKIYVNYSQ